MEGCQQGKLMFCTECGGTCIEGAKFCAQCGHTLGNDHVVSTVGVIDFRDVARTDAKPQVRQVRPWVRYWARMFDIYLWLLVAESAAGAFAATLARPENLAAILMSINYFFIFGIFFLWVFVEALFLSSFGWTPGKWLFRITVHADGGGPPSYREALSRSILVWWRGLAIGLPLISVITMLYARKTLKDKQITSWDEDGGFCVEHARIEAWRVVFAVVFFVVIGVVFSASRLATSRAYADQVIATRSSTATPANVFDQFDARPTSNSDGTIPYHPAAAPPDTSRTVSPVVSANGVTGKVVWDDERPTPLQGYAYQSPPPPSGFVPDTSAPPVPSIDAAAESARWTSDVTAFFREHPALNYQQNAQILQKHLDTGPTTGLTNRQMLNNAFYASEADSLWANGP